MQDTRDYNMLAGKELIKVPHERVLSFYSLPNIRDYLFALWDTYADKSSIERPCIPHSISYLFYLFDMNIELVNLALSKLPPYKITPTLSEYDIEVILLAYSLKSELRQDRLKELQKKMFSFSLADLPAYRKSLDALYASCKVNKSQFTLYYANHTYFQPDVMEVKKLIELLSVYGNITMFEAYSKLRAIFS